MHSLFLTLYVIAVGAMAVWWVMRLLTARRRQERLAALVSIFDPGTAEMRKKELISGQSKRSSVFGLFHGRAASVSIQSGFSSNVRVCVAGRFYLPFEVDTKAYRKLDAIRNRLKNFGGGIWFLLYIAFFLETITEYTISPWKMIGAVSLFYLIFAGLITSYGKWMGYFDGPGESRWEVSFPGSIPLQYASYTPARVRPVTDRPEIRESIARLIDSRHIGHLRSPGQIGIPRKSGGWDNSVEANCMYREKLLHRDSIQLVLTDLSALCTSIEQIAPSNESRGVPVPQAL